MTRLLPFVLAALLVCSIPAVAVSGSIAPTAEPAASSSTGPQAAVDAPAVGRLSLSDGPTVSGEGYVVVDLGAAIDSDSSRLETRYEDHRFDVRMETADSDADRRAIIREEADDLSAAVAQLRERERSAYMAYYEGERSERDLLAELAVIHTNAVVLEGSVATLGEYTAATPGVSLDSELETMAVETRTLQGPVRERVAAMMRGEADPTRVYVETDGQGIVLAAIDGDRFHREAHRIDHRDSEADTQYSSLGQSEDRIAELYPTIFPEARWSYSEIGHSTHRGTATYDRGSLTVFLDTGTGDVYREFRTLRLDRVDTTTVTSETNGGITATVSGTAPGGPATVTLTDAQTNAPVSGEVTLDGRTVGETNDDGELWFVAPRDPVTGEATVGSTTVEFTTADEASEQNVARTDDDERS